MQVHSSVAPLALATMIGTWVFAAYPTWCAFFVRRRLGDSQLWLLRSFLVMTYIVSFLILPTSILDMGWVVVPTVLCLLSLDASLAHIALAEAYAKEGRPEPLTRFLALYLPLLALLFLAVGVMIGESARMLDEQTSLATMRELTLASFTIIGIVPLVGAIGFMPVSYLRRHSRVELVAQ